MAGEDAAYGSRSQRPALRLDPAAALVEREAQDPLDDWHAARLALASATADFQRRGSEPLASTDTGGAGASLRLQTQRKSVAAIPQERASLADLWEEPSPTRDVWTPPNSAPMRTPRRSPGTSHDAGAPTSPWSDSGTMHPSAWSPERTERAAHVRNVSASRLASAHALRQGPEPLARPRHSAPHSALDLQRPGPALTTPQCTALDPPVSPRSATDVGGDRRRSADTMGGQLPLDRLPPADDGPHRVWPRAVSMQAGPPRSAAGRARVTSLRSVSFAHDLSGGAGGGAAGAAAADADAAPVSPRSTPRRTPEAAPEPQPAADDRRPHLDGHGDSPGELSTSPAAQGAVPPTSPAAQGAVPATSPPWPVMPPAAYMGTPAMPYLPLPACAFVIKSFNEVDVCNSLQYGIWTSTEKGNQRLDRAWAQHAHAGPIYLFFSVNGSGQFCGVAQMLSGVDRTKRSAVWVEAQRWRGLFRVSWLLVRNVPNSQLRHIVLENTPERKSVTQSRDTQELPPHTAAAMLQVMSTYPTHDTLLRHMQAPQPPMPPDRPNIHYYYGS